VITRLDQHQDLAKSGFIRDVSERLYLLGYDVNYKRLSPSKKKSRTSPRDVVHAQNSWFTQAVVTVIYPPAKDPLVVLQGSVRDPEGDQLGRFEIADLESLWRFVEENGQCPCGEQMYSETSARKVIARSLHRRGNRGDERRMTACPAGWATVFHLN
jgi:hypothetical protein